MRKQQFDTWLMKEAARMAGNESRSIKEIIKGGYRSKMYIAFKYYEANTFLGLTSDEAMKVNEMILKLKNNDDELTKEYTKTLKLYKSFLTRDINTKKAIIKLLKKETIKKDKLEMKSIRLSNYSAFINGDLNSLSLAKAKSLLDF